MMRLLRATCAAMALAACPAAEERLPLAEVAFVDCRDVVDSPDGPVCELDRDGARRISVWMPGELVAQIDGEPQTPISRVAVDGGWRIELEVPGDAGALTLSGLDAAQPLWRLPFTWTDSTSRPALTQAIDAMRRAYYESRMTDCRREAKHAFSLAEAQRRGLSAILAARIGAACSGAEPWHEWAAMAAPILAGPDEREVDRAALESQYFHREGALPQALAATERGRERALRVGLPSSYIELALMKANVLAEMGDFSAAVAAMQAELERDSTSTANPCARASIHINLAWALLQQAERVPTATHASPHDALHRGLALAEAPDSECRRADVIAFRLNLVRALQLDQRWQEADLELETLAHELKDDGDGALRAEYQLLRARSLLAVGQAAAARTALESTLAYRDLPDDLHLELTLARGEVAEALGSWQEGVEFYAKSRRMTNDRLRGLPADGGLQRFLVDRLRGVQRLVELSSSRFMDDAAAFRRAREAAGTEVRWLGQRGADRSRRGEYLAWRDKHERALMDAWDLPPSERQRLLDLGERAAVVEEVVLLGGGSSYDPSRFEFRPPAPGELLLLYFPLDARRFMAFAAAETGVESAVLDLEQSALPVEAEVWSDEALKEWSERLLAPLAEPIDRARSIRVLPSFGVQALPFHALPWRGRPLLAHTAVTYSLDLPVRSERRSTPGEHQVLIVGDPLGDLGGARRESEALRASIATPGVESLVGLRATGPAVRASLAKFNHFHYAGHSASAGAFGWASTLRLAQDTRLTVADIIALAQVPQTVVLLSCDAGHVSRDPRAQGISLAGAFIFSGSEAVIAMSTAIDAAEAPRLASAFQGRLGDAPSIAVMYRTGLLRLREGALSDTAWQGLRLWVP